MEDGDPFCFNCGTLAFKRRSHDQREPVKTSNDPTHPTDRYMPHTAVLMLHSAPQKWTEPEMANILKVSRKFIRNVYEELGIYCHGIDAYLDTN